MTFSPNEVEYFFFQRPPQNHPKISFFIIFPTAPTMSAVGKEPHLSFFLLFFRGPLLDWFGQIMLYSHWSTQTWCSTNACVPATDEAVVCTLIEPSNAGAY